MTRFQFGFDFGLFIFWRTVSAARFAKKVQPLLLLTTQLETITPEELLPFFGGDLVLRDGWRLYRGVRDKEKIIHKGENFEWKP
jgi:hypothetical protein